MDQDCLTMGPGELQLNVQVPSPTHFFRNDGGNDDLITFWEIGLLHIRVELLSMYKALYSLGVLQKLLTKHLYENQILSFAASAQQKFTERYKQKSGSSTFQEMGHIFAIHCKVAGAGVLWALKYKIHGSHFFHSASTWLVARVDESLRLIP